MFHSLGLDDVLAHADGSLGARISPRLASLWCYAYKFALRACTKDKHAGSCDAAVEVERGNRLVPDWVSADIGQ